MSELEHKVRIALRAAQMKRKIVPALLIDLHRRIEDLHEEYVGEKKDKKKGWPIFEISSHERHQQLPGYGGVWHSYESIDYDGMCGFYITDYYKRHHEIVSFLEGVGVPGIKVSKLDQLYQSLKAKLPFKEGKYKSLLFADEKNANDGAHFVYLPSGQIFHYKCGHDKKELGENDVFGYPQAFKDLKATPWFHNQHPIFNTMNYKAKLFLICLEVGDLLDTEQRVDTGQRALPSP